MKFTKMHGCGNDYIYVNCFEEDVPDPAAVAPVVSDRHVGIGSDGLILIKPSDVADCRMQMFNPDGSEAEMCGNGIRCVAKYVFDHGITDKTELDVETGAGTKHLVLTVSDGVVSKVRVNMGAPRLERTDIPMKGPMGKVLCEPLAVDGRTVEITCVSMGNPHAVVKIDVDPVDYPVNEIGPQIEMHPAFPACTNVEFVQVVSPTEIRQRTWERGAGETLACGTGASAVAVACALNEWTERTVLIHLLGGDLEIEWADDGQVHMTGPAVEVFSGEIVL
jgi:diaminopimelate epimerase